MAEVTISRYLEAAPEMVFQFMTQTEKLLKWWGPEGINVAEHDLDFSSEGNWFSVMRSKEGGRYKVSGEVLEIVPPKSVTMT
jgi:uncharacterized protein YndB with AHSA1/START domain